MRDDSVKIHNPYVISGPDRMNRIAEFKIRLTMAGVEGRTEIIFEASEPIVTDHGLFLSIMDIISSKISQVGEGGKGIRSKIVDMANTMFKDLLERGLARFEDESAEADVFFSDLEIVRAEKSQLFKILDVSKNYN